MHYSPHWPVRTINSNECNWSPPTRGPASLVKNINFMGNKAGTNKTSKICREMTVVMRLADNCLTRRKVNLRVFWIPSTQASWAWCQNFTCPQETLAHFIFSRSQPVTLACSSKHSGFFRAQYKFDSHQCVLPFVIKFLSQIWPQVSILLQRSKFPPRIMKIAQGHKAKLHSWMFKW